MPESGHPPFKFADCVRELQNWNVLAVAGMCKVHAEENCLSAGQFPCPLCRTGTVIYSIAANNGHVRANCDRVCADGARCISFVE